MPFIKKEEQITTTVTTGFTCDSCNVDYDEFHLTDCVHLQHSFGYYSNHDQEEIDVVMCENCFHEMLVNTIPSIQ